jgi:hypothetical protein
MASQQSTTNPSLFRRWENYQPSKSMLFWACLSAVIATIVLGFSWGGWVTGSTSQTLARTASEAARGELAAAICVERFDAAPDAGAKLAELKALSDSYKKLQFVEAGGWATMPGQTAPDRLGAQSCATVLAS